MIVETKCHTILLKLTLFLQKQIVHGRVKYCPAVSMMLDSSKKNSPIVLWKTGSTTVVSFADPMRNVSWILFTGGTELGTQVNLLAPELFFLILAHPVYKM